MLLCADCEECMRAYIGDFHFQASRQAKEFNALAGIYVSILVIFFVFANWASLAGALSSHQAVFTYPFKVFTLHVTRYMLTSLSCGNRNAEVIHVNMESFI